MECAEHCVYISVRSPKLNLGGRGGVGFGVGEKLPADNVTALSRCPKKSHAIPQSCIM